MSYLPSSPGITNLSDVLQKLPKRSALILRALDEIMRSEDSPLSKGDRELIFSYASVLNECDFCSSSHKPAAEAFGVDEFLFEQLQCDIETAGMDEKLKPLLRFIQKLTYSPYAITKNDVEPIFDAGWDERAFVDAVSVCAVANCMNRFVSGWGVDVDSETARQSGIKMLLDLGYDGWAAQLEEGMVS